MKNQFYVIFIFKGTVFMNFTAEKNIFCLSYIFGPRGPNFNFKIALETCLYKLSKPPFKLKSLHRNRSYGIKNVPPPLVQIKKSRAGATPPGSPVMI